MQPFMEANGKRSEKQATATTQNNKEFISKKHISPI
jgi:hypothetical protein